MAKSWSRFSANISVLATALLLGAAVGNRGTEAAVSIAGQAGGYLRMPAGASAAAQGGAYSASPDYLNAWYNPAMLPTHRQPSTALGGAFRSMGRTEGFASFDFRIPPRAGLGLALLYRGDPFLDDLRDERGEPLGAASYTSMTIRAAAGYIFSRQVSAGAGLGFYYQSLPTGWDATSSKTISSSVVGIGGFDFALRYRFSEALSSTVMLRHLGLKMNWELVSGTAGFNASSSDKVLPEVVLALQLERTLYNRPLIWSSDFVGYLIDEQGKRLKPAEALWHNGVEWRTWDKFWIRAGVGEVPLSSRLFSEPTHYRAGFAPRFSFGFAADLKNVHNGLQLNYAFSTDKAMAGVEQIVDLHYAF